MNNTIVVVDDAQANLLLMANLLQDKGYDVRIANTATRALTLIERHPPDLILLDVNLPDKDGYFVCRQLKANHALESIPVLFLSADDDADSKRRAFEAGGAEYLVKPFDATEVLARVALHLGVANARQEAQTLRNEASFWRARAEAALSALGEVGQGCTLRQRLDDGPDLMPEEATFIARELCAAVVALHEQGTVHGGIRPESVFLAGATTSVPRVRLFAASVAGLNASGDPYAAPELTLNPTASTASDVYALGALLEEILGKAELSPPGALSERARSTSVDARPTAKDLASSF